MWIWKLLFQYRLVLQSMVSRELASRYAGSALGIAWLVLYPLGFLALYSTVNIYIFSLQSQKMTVNEYLLLVFCGLVPFLAIAETLSTSTSSIPANRDIVMGTLFPAELLPVRYAGSSMAVLVVGFSFLMLGTWLQGIFHWTQLLLPLAMLLQLVFMVGVAWICATIYVFFRDFGQMLGLIILALMMLSPIGFDRSMMPAGVKLISAFNPLAHFMEMYRALVLRGEMPWYDMAISALIAFATFQFGAFVFSRLKVAFSDYL